MSAVQRLRDEVRSLPGLTSLVELALKEHDVKLRASAAEQMTLLESAMDADTKEIKSDIELLLGTIDDVWLGVRSLDDLHRLAKQQAGDYLVDIYGLRG